MVEHQLVVANVNCLLQDTSKGTVNLVQLSAYHLVLIRHSCFTDIYYFIKMHLLSSQKCFLPLK